MKRLQAVVLCGGMGTRLRPHLGDEPISLVPIAGRPFLSVLFSHLMRGGIIDIVLCTGHGSELIETTFGDGSRLAMSIAYSIEHEPLGTGGALKHAEAAIHSTPFLLLNGDSLVDLDIRAFLLAHRESGALATMALARVANTQRYGCVKLDARGAVVEFSEKGAANGSAFLSHDGLINAGFYALDRRLLREIPNLRRPISFEHEVLPALIGRGLFGYPTDGFFIDIGVPEDYELAKIEIPRRFGLARSHSR